MQCKGQSHNSIFGIAWNSVLALMLVLLVLIVVVLFIVLTAQPAQGQTSVPTRPCLCPNHGAVSGLQAESDSPGERPV